MLRNSLPLIIGAFAVHNSLDRLVQGMLMGLLMHRLFLCLGTSILIAANRSKTRKFDDSYTRIAASFLYLSMILIILPTILRASSPDAGILGLLKISRWCAVFLLLLLGLLLFYTLKTETKFWSNADEVRSSHFPLFSVQQILDRFLSLILIHMESSPLQNLLI